MTVRTIEVTVRPISQMRVKITARLKEDGHTLSERSRTVLNTQGAEFTQKLAIELLEGAQDTVLWHYRQMELFATR